MERIDTKLREVMAKVESEQTTTSSGQRIESPLDAKTCWRCQGVHYQLFVAGGYSYAKPCLCLRRTRLKKALSVIPPIFGRPKLSRTKARPDLHPSQDLAVPYIKAHPDESYLLTGLNGTGKSYLGWALYRHALAKGRRAIACPVRDLIADFRRAEIQLGEKDEEGKTITVDSPRITPDRLRQTTDRVTLFLDEFEKARPSEFAAEQLFVLLDAAKSFGHQLIVTSNFPTKRLIQHWGRIDPVWGTSIATRLEGCNEIEFF